MDSLVHVFYEIAGTSGAFLSTATIKFFGYVFSTGIVGGLFFLSSMLYALINTDLFFPTTAVVKQTSSYHNPVMGFLREWKASFVLGVKIVFSSRKYIWLLPCYVLACYSSFVRKYYVPILCKDRDQRRISNWLYDSVQ